MKRIDFTRFSVYCFSLLVALFLAGIMIGPVAIPLDRVFSGNYSDILKLRLLRGFAAVLVGAGLSLSGAILQSVMRNPLAEPYVLGISSGASLAAVIALIFFPVFYAVSGLAFIGGTITILIVYNLAKIDNKMYAENMVIAGVLMSALFSGVLMFIIANSPSTKVHSAMWWLMGNLQTYKVLPLALTAVVVLPCILIALLFSKELNALSLGDEEALHLGIEPDRIKKIFIIIAALVASITVAMCGVIGFVGLMVPHITRKILGPDNRKLILGSAILGSSFLLLCDIISRSVVFPGELPIGAITSLAGVPFFIYILKRHRKASFK